MSKSKQSIDFPEDCDDPSDRIQINLQASHQKILVPEDSDSSGDANLNLNDGVNSPGAES